MVARSPTGTIFYESANKPVPIVATILRTIEADRHEAATQVKADPLNKGSDMWEKRWQMTNSYIPNFYCFVAVNFIMEASQAVGRWPLSARVRV